MGTVHLIVDPLARVRDAGAALLVRGDGDYAPARRRIHAAIEAQGDDETTIIIRHPALHEWFSDLHTSPWVRYEVYSPRDDFARTFGVSLPSDMLDADMVELDLEGLAHRDPPDGSDIEAWIVGRVLGAAWLVDVPSEETLIDVVASLLVILAPNDWLLGRVRERLQRWTQRDSSDRSELWRFLARDPIPQRVEALVAYAAVARYPKPLRKEWLADLWQGLDVLEMLDDVADRLRVIPLPAGLRARLEEHVRAFLSEKGETANVEQLFTYTTGALASEARVLARALLDRPEQLTVETWQRLEAIAWPDDRALLDRVRLRMPVAMPEAIPLEWTAAHSAAVATWVEERYLPWYRAVRYREEVVDADTVCASFAQWVARAYPDLLARLHDTVVGVRDRVEELIASGRAVIWIVVDALGVEGVSVLADACGRRGMQVTAQALQLTVLPTVTHVAKPALLSGTPPLQRAQGADATSLPEYRRIVASGRWGDAGIVGGDWEQRSLVDLVAGDEALLWVYLVNRLDQQVVHARMGFEERARQLSRLCDDLAEAAQEAQEAAVTRYGRRPAVVFSADHGYTTPAPGHLVIETSAQSSHGRCIVLGDADTPPGEGWLLLDPPQRFGLSRRYALAYGNRFIGEISPLLATHGGVNPEEVYVPYLECDGTPPIVGAPTLTNRSTVLAEAPEQELALVLRNGNPVELTDVTLDADLFREPVTVVRLFRGAEEVVHPVLVRGPYPAGPVRIVVAVTYTALGSEPITEHVTLYLEVESPLQAPTDEQQAFEEMFDD